MIGSHLHTRMSPRRAMQAVWWLLMAGGLALLWRGGHAP